MRFLCLLLACLLTGCSGVAVTVNYTPPMTFGLTFDARPLYPPQTPPATAPSPATAPAGVKP